MYKTMTIALCAILHLTVVAVADQNPKANLVYRSTLDSESAVTSPVVGASGTCTDATFVDGKFGKALYVPAHTGVARIPLSDGLPTTKGCIGFWAKLQEGKSTFGDGGDPIFLRILRADEKEFSTFEYNSNNGGGGGGVWSRLPGLSIASHECSWTMNYSTVLGEDYASWHHYALVWNVDGIAALEDSSRAAILIDGKVVARANGGDSWDRDGFLTKMAQSLTVTFCYPGAGWGKSAFAIDELSIWDSDAVSLQDMIPDDSQDLEANDNRVSCSTLDSESAVTSPGVGASGTCTDATFVDGKFGKALYVPAGASVATIPLPDGLPAESGCIEFWAKINTTATTFGDGGNPTFISVNRVDTGGLICTLHFNANDGGGRGGLCVGLCNLSTGTDTWSGYKSYSTYISGDVGDWHHYAIVWNVDGIAYVEGNPRLVVLLDGKSMITANGDSTWSKEVFVDRMSLPLNINLSTTKPNESRKPYLIDELRIWKTDAAAFGGLPKYANATYVYDGKAHSLGAPLGASGTEVFGYSLSESGPFADEMPTLTNVGTMRVWYSVTANGKSSVSSATVTVSKRTVVFTSASAEKQYDGTPLSADSVSIKGEVPDGEGFSFTVTGQRTAVGESDNVFTWTANKGTNPDNYNVKLVYGKLAVTMDELSGVQSYEIISSPSGGEAVRITSLSYPDGGDVTLPAAVCGLPVAEIAADALSGSSVSGVCVPAGISAPGTLFANLANLTNVSFAADCKVASAVDFRGSAALREVVLPAQVVLAPWAFLGCWDLERVVFAGEPPFGGKVDGMALQTLLLASTSPASLLQMADMICYPEACEEKWE